MKNSKKKKEELLTHIRNSSFEENEKRGKLKRNDVLDIRNAHRLGCFSNAEIGRAYNVSCTCIWNIVNNKRWTNL